MTDDASWTVRSTVSASRLTSGQGRWGTRRRRRRSFDRPKLWPASYWRGSRQVATREPYRTGRQSQTPKEPVSIGLSRSIAESEAVQSDVSRVRRPPLAAVAATTNSVAIRVPAHDGPGTFQPTPTAIVSSSVASPRPRIPEAARPQNQAPMSGPLNGLVTDSTGVRPSGLPAAWFPARSSGSCAAPCHQRPPWRGSTLSAVTLRTRTHSAAWPGVSASAACFMKL